MKVLITGATGYIGSALVEYLDSETDHNIIAHCRKLPQYFDSWRNRFAVVETDIRDKERLLEVLDPDIDAIVHLAAFNDVDTGQSPREALEVNGYGTRTILEIAEELGSRNVIYFSTLKVYGSNLEGTYSVSSPLDCEDDYAVTHAVAERYCQMYSSAHGLTTNVVRPSNVFGAPVHSQIDRWSLVPATFCKSAVEEGEIRLRSSGRQSRDFVSLDYLCEAIDRLLGSSGSGHNIYNITSENTIKIWKVAKIVEQAATDVLQEEIELSRKDDKPESSNEFTAKNNLLLPPKEDEVFGKLDEECRKMVEALSK